MADYRYLAIDPDGRERRGKVTAPSAEAAQQQLGQRKLYVVKVEEGTEAKASKGRSLFGARSEKLSRNELLVFTQQLSTLASVSPLEEALRTVMRQTERDAARAVLARVHEGVYSGRRLSEAMRGEPKSFPALYAAMVSAGEGSGSLPVILQRLALWLERQQQVRGKLFSALAYPSTVAVFAIGVVTALMVFVVPRVVEQFDSFGQTLPLLTRIVIAISGFLASYWWAILGVIALAVLGGLFALRQPGIRLAAHHALLKLPLFGKVLRNVHAAHLARTLSTMVGSRLPLLEGLLLTEPTIRNLAIRQAMGNISEAVRGGTSLSTAMRKEEVLPPILVYLAASGESAGQLDQMLEKAADSLERDFDRLTATTLSLLEPAIIILMGFIVALIILAIMLPVLQLQSLVGQ